MKVKHLLNEKPTSPELTEESELINELLEEKESELYELIEEKSELNEIEEELELNEDNIFLHLIEGQIQSIDSFKKNNNDLTETIRTLKQSLENKYKEIMRLNGNYSCDTPKNDPFLHSATRKSAQYDVPSINHLSYREQYDENNQTIEALKNENLLLYNEAKNLDQQIKGSECKIADLKKPQR